MLQVLQQLFFFPFQVMLLCKVLCNSVVKIKIRTVCCNQKTMLHTYCKMETTSNTSSITKSMPKKSIIYHFPDLLHFYLICCKYEAMCCKCCSNPFYWLFWKFKFWTKPSLKVSWKCVIDIYIEAVCCNGAIMLHICNNIQKTFVSSVKKSKVKILK